MYTTLSSGSDAWRYTLGTSKFCTALPSWVPINNDTNSASNAMVDVVASSRGIWVRWRPPYAYVLPLILMHCFYLLKLTALSAPDFSWRDMIVASWSPKTSRL